MGLVQRYNGDPFTMIAAGTITKYAALVSDDGLTVVVSAADNDANFVGFAQNAGVSGEAIRISPNGSYVKAIAGEATIAAGDWLMTYSTAGRVTTKGTTAATAYNVIGKAMEAGDTAGDEITVFQQAYYERVDAVV